MLKNDTKQIPPYALIQHQPPENITISHIEGFVPCIISWMAEKYNFT